MEFIEKNTLYDAWQNEKDAGKFIEAFESQYDIEEIQRIVASCSSSEQAFKKLCERYPSLDYDQLKKNFDDLVRQMQEKQNPESEEVLDIEDDDLEAVAGGSFGSWLKKNWAGIAVGGAIMVASSAIGMPMLGMTLAPMAMQMTNSQVAKKTTASDAELDKSHTL